MRGLGRSDISDTYSKPTNHGHVFLYKIFIVTVFFSHIFFSTQPLRKVCVANRNKGQFCLQLLRTFALIVSAHPYYARKFTCHVIHRARALNTKLKNNRADGHFYSFAWI